MTLKTMKDLGKLEGLNVMVFDEETSLTGLYGFSLGKTVLRHSQLMGGYFNTPRIICICYKWLHEDESRILHWGTSEDDERAMVKAFDAELKKADIVIGKNNTSFDNKKLNTLRALLKCPPNPDWTLASHDLETQMRRHFKFLSHTLDHVSELTGFGGKNSMEFSDWTALFNWRTLQIAESKLEEPCRKTLSALSQTLFGKPITEVEKLGRAAFKKMNTYGCKDVYDTESLILELEPHMSFKYNVGKMKATGGCVKCASTDLIRNDTRAINSKPHKRLVCRNCGFSGNYASILAGDKLGVVRGL